MATPSILFCSPQGPAGGWIHLEYLHYLRSLKERAFEVDYTSSLDEFTWERIRNYNVLVVYIMPGPLNTSIWHTSPKPDEDEQFLRCFEDYVSQGGGVFLCPMERNTFNQHLKPITDNIKATLPLSYIVAKNAEESKDNISRLTYPPTDVPVAYTNNIDRDLPWPEITNGVTDLWYPYQRHYNAADGGPIFFENDAGGAWKIVVSALDSFWTKAIVPMDSKDVGGCNIPGPEDDVKTSDGAEHPPLFAVREYKGGRVALLNQWPQYTIGSGLKQFYDNEVLENGFKNRPSHWGRLLLNTFHWLSKPSLETFPPKLGGYVTTRDRLIPPNLGKSVRENVQTTCHAEYRWQKLLDMWQASSPQLQSGPFRGLIGAKTSYSNPAYGSVRAYAEVARSNNVNFIIFLDEFSGLTSVTYWRLRNDCERMSKEFGVHLIPGFTIECNTGDEMFFYGPDMPWLPDDVLVGEKKNLFYLQRQDGNDFKFAGQQNGQVFLLKHMPFSASGNPDRLNWGFFNFHLSPRKMKIKDLRLHGAAAVWYYKSGACVEDCTDDYLLASHGSIECTPIAINEVCTVREFSREITENRALTYVNGPSTDNKSFEYGLYYYISSPRWDTFISNGPLIEYWARGLWGTWPQLDSTVGVSTYGAEEFVSPVAIREPARLSIRASGGNVLKDVSIHNGRDLFRRISLDESNDKLRYAENIMVNNAVQKNLVLVVTDAKGHKAVSSVRQCRKTGVRSIYECGDRRNHCISWSGQLFGRGPFPGIAHAVPPLPDDVWGETWDGGGGNPAIVHRVDCRPQVNTTLGYELGPRFNQTAIVEFSDEGAVAVTSEQGELFDAHVEPVDPDKPGFNTVGDGMTMFGPLGGPSELFSCALRYREYLTAGARSVKYGTDSGRPFGVGVPPTGTKELDYRKGINAALFRSEITFKKSCTLNNALENNYSPGWWPQGAGPLLGRAYASGGITSSEIFVLFGGGEKVEEYPLLGLEPHKIKPGEWFALYAKENGSVSVRTSKHVFIVREHPIIVKFLGLENDFFDVLGAAQVHAGQSRVWELFSLGIPIDIEIAHKEDISRRVAYLHEPWRLHVLRGAKLRWEESPGLVECRPERFTVEVRVPKPTWRTDLTLPLRVSGLNQRWTALLFQKQGFVRPENIYNLPPERIREVGIDVHGYAYVPLYVDEAEQTHVVVGHPVVADNRAGQELFIQVTHLYYPQDEINNHRWHVSVNNPTDRPITTTLRKAMDLPDLHILNEGTPVTIKPGEYRVLAGAYPPARPAGL